MTRPSTIRFARGTVGLITVIALAIIAATMSQPGGAEAATTKFYFISGNTFTSSGGVPYARQGTGCVYQMPLDVPMTAPVNLPQGAVVTAIRLYTYDPSVSPTVSTAWLQRNDGRGNVSNTLSATSQSAFYGYQDNKNTVANNTTIANQTYSYLVEWRKVGGSDSFNLSLCGVRLTYHL